MNNLLFIYDTETNGLPLYSEPSEDPRQPYVTQIAAELCDEHTGETLASMNVLIKPNGWIIPPEVIALNGITTEKCEAYGVPSEVALSTFIHMWTKCSLRVGHNEPFDRRIVRIAMKRSEAYGRNDSPDAWKAAPSFCTQSNSTKIINAARPVGEKKKTANLAEAYKHFTGKELVNAHNAAADVAACKAVYFGIKAHQLKEAA